MTYFKFFRMVMEGIGWASFFVTGLMVIIISCQRVMMFFEDKGSKNWLNG